MLTHSVVSDSLRPRDLQYARPPCLHRLPELFIASVRCVENRRELSPSSGGQSPPAGCQQGCTPLPGLGQLPRPCSRGPLSSHTASLPCVCTSSLHLSPENTCSLIGDRAYLGQQHLKLIIFTSHPPPPSKVPASSAPTISPEHRGHSLPVGSGCSTRLCG